MLRIGEIMRKSWLGSAILLITTRIFLGLRQTSFSGALAGVGLAASDVWVLSHEREPKMAMD